MAERDHEPQAPGGDARPLDEAELDTIAGGKRTPVADAHDKYGNTETPYAQP